MISRYETLVYFPQFESSALGNKLEETYKLLPQVYPIAAQPATRLKRITTNDRGECPRVVTTAFDRGKRGAVKSEISPSTYPPINERITLYDNHGTDIEAIHHPRFHSLSCRALRKDAKDARGAKIVGGGHFDG